MINHCHRDRRVLESDVPASTCDTVSHERRLWGQIERTAIGGVVVGDREGSTDIWERRQISEDIVTLGQHAVGSIRARNRGKRLRFVVINRAIRNECSTDDGWNGEKSDDRGEFHVCDRKKVEVPVA